MSVSARVAQEMGVKLGNEVMPYVMILDASSCDSFLLSSLLQYKGPLVFTFVSVVNLSSAPHDPTRTS